MAIRTKTVEYAFDGSRTTLATATRYEFQTMSIYLPETASRTFRSVMIEVNYRDNQTTALSQTAALIGIKLQTASFSNQTVTTTLVNSGENQSFVLVRDVTDYFTGSFTSNPTASCQVALTLTGQATSNHAAKLYITYDYDDIHNTRVKTVRVPLQSISGSLTAGPTNITSLRSRIPQLNTFLPEVSKTYRNIWFEIYANEASQNTTDGILTMQLDAETAVSSAVLEHALNSATYLKHIWQRNNMTTTTTHSLSFGTVAASGMVNIGAVMGVTYEYVSSSTSQSMNSLLIPMMEESGFVGSSGPSGSSGSYPSRTVQELRVSEPGPISLEQSGLVAFFNSTSTDTIAQRIDPIKIKVGTQAYVDYSRGNPGTLSCGQYSIVHAFDSSSVTFGRGLNSIPIEVLASQSDEGRTVSNLSILGYINYKSGIATGSDSIHNQTRIFEIGEQTAINGVQRYDYTFAPVAQTGSNFRTTGLGFATLLNLGATKTAISLTARATDAERLSFSTGWLPLYESIVDASVERGVCTSFARARREFLRYIGDPQTSTRINLSVPRTYRVEAAGPSTTPSLANTMVGGLYTFWTYHNIATAVTRSISGFSSGNGSGLNVKIYESGSEELLYTTTSVSGGNYSFLAYDPNRTLYAVVHDTGSGAVGRSNYFTPVV